VAIFFGAVSPPLLLALTFANGIGLAMRWPVFAAIVPELVPRPSCRRRWRSTAWR
jgi:MFS family permease